jgi:DMSO/TMAO reductase YedYZ molybdopterin-dependent catalytic subunit
MEVKKVEKVKQHKRLVIATSTLLFLALIVAGVYWQTMPESPQPSPSPSPSSSPSPSPSPSSSPSPSQTPLPSPSASPPISLPPQEIHAYEGQDLSSIADFRENSINGPQYINESTYRLTITGLVNKTLEYTYDDVINGFQKYQKVVTLFCVEGWSVKILWEGFLLKDLLNEAGINPQALVVIFYAYDGYSTAMPLDYLLNNNILIAYKMNNVTLPPERGFPFQLVAENKFGYKWIKWITKIELSDNADYLGYWESRGYSNNAGLP